MTPESNAPSVDPHIVGNAFVQEYYNHLYESPANVHKFYHEGSVLGRPGLDGSMVYVNSLKDINDQIMSCDYQNSRIEILTADSQTSFKNAVATVVTGLVIGKDGERKTFCQSFVLVPQKGSCYYVLNDFLRYVSDELVEPEATEEVEESPRVIESTETITAEPANETVEAVIIPSQAKTTVTKPTSAVANAHAKVPKEKVVVNGNSNLPKAAEAKFQEDAPKRSFAAIVQCTPSNVKDSPVKPKPVEKPKIAPEPKAPAPIPEHPSAETTEKPGQGGSIFVANLPMDATPEQLFETFKGFGAIRKGGIQVRSYPEKRNCFGFVAFENSEAIKNVFQAHNETAIRIGNRRASIEEKRGKDNENGGRPFVRNNGYYKNENGYRRNDGNGPRGNGSNGGRGYGRQKSEAGGDGKANQKNGHGNTKTKN
ncbi:unnamed protein product [Arabis nemorensis]|uniref:RRM domain-containing protein n=1 Tax=Arabis nemorensis TaxID=586526 RepID=A0A565BRL5_9BRAS|nr:unnamed protein product [Arabis nemorensis]